MGDTDEFSYVEKSILNCPLRNLKFIQLGYWITARCQAWVSSKGGIQMATEERTVQRVSTSRLSQVTEQPEILLWLQGQRPLHTLIPEDTDPTTHCSRLVTLISQAGFKNHPSAALSPGQQRIFCFNLMPSSSCFSLGTFVSLGCPKSVLAIRLNNTSLKREVFQQTQTTAALST